MVLSSLLSQVFCWVASAWVYRASSPYSAISATGGLKTDSSGIFPRMEGNFDRVSFGSDSGTFQVQLPGPPMCGMFSAAAVGVKGACTPPEEALASSRICQEFHRKWIWQAGTGSWVSSSQSTIISTLHVLWSQEGKSRVVVPGAPGLGLSSDQPGTLHPQTPLFLFPPGVGWAVTSPRDS